MKGRVAEVERLSSLVSIMIIWFIVFFILSQVIIERNWLPEQVTNLRLMHLCIASIGAIFIGILVGLLSGQPVFFVGTVTILCSSIISWKYRNKYDHFERGKSK